MYMRVIACVYAYARVCVCVYVCVIVGMRVRYFRHLAIFDCFVMSYAHVIEHIVPAPILPRALPSQVNLTTIKGGTKPTEKQRNKGKETEVITLMSQEMRVRYFAFHDVLYRKQYDNQQLRQTLRP